MLEDEDGALLLDEPEPDGVLLDAAPEGELLEPLAALPPVLLGGVPEALELDEPPEAGALGEALDEDEPVLSAVEPGVVAEPEAEPEAEPDGAVDEEPDGEVVEPADEEEPEEPGALAPVLGESPQAVSKVALSARDTADAIMESLIEGLRGWGTMLCSKVRASLVQTTQ